METKGGAISKKLPFARTSITSTWILQTKACMYVMMASLANSGPVPKDTSTSEAEHPERPKTQQQMLRFSRFKKKKKKTAIKMKTKASGPADQDSRTPESR